MGWSVMPECHGWIERTFLLRILRTFRVRVTRQISSVPGGEDALIERANDGVALRRDQGAI